VSDAPPDPAAPAAAGPVPAVADTSYLLPFGAADYRRLLRVLHPQAAVAPVTVRAELEGLADRSGDRTKQQAAAALLSRKGVPILYRDVDDSDAALRTALLDELHADAVAHGKADGARREGSTANLGEADCMCLSRTSTEPLRCNDNGARRVAAARRIATRSTAEDLRVLLEHDYTPNQLVQIARRMQPLEIGDVVSGPGYFRRPRRPTGPEEQVAPADGSAGT
jgi:hypothetical protein